MWVLNPKGIKVEIQVEVWPELKLKGYKALDLQADEAEEQELIERAEDILFVEEV